MAKRRVAKRGRDDSGSAESAADQTRSSTLSPSGLVLIGRQATWAILGGLMVYVAYFPCDAVDGMRGGGLWLGLFAFSWLGLVAMVHWNHQAGGMLKSLSWLDGLLAALALWMMLAAIGTSTSWFGLNWGNLRTSTNQAWLWATGPAIVIAARRVMHPISVRRSFVALAFALSVGLAVDTLYQDWISLPQMRADYDRDPETSLRLAGIDAPPNSSLRMVFENRLRDGGPTATFALANSLAGVLFLGVLVPVTIVRARWGELSKGWLVSLGVSMALTFAALLATRSRASLVAMFFGILLIGWLFSRGQPNRRRMGMTAAILLSLAAIALMILLAIFGNPEWFSQAPSSLAFRLQYWRSTWEMVFDRPLFGAGPGNFQAIYSRYHQLSSTEQIADPHNFVFETFASGGWLALALLIGIGLAAYRAALPSRFIDQPSPKAARSWWAGAAMTLGLIWFLGMVIGRTPDIESHRFAIPVAFAVGWMGDRAMSKMKSADLDKMILAAGAALLVHLSVSGGWMVPGVVMFLWIGLAAITRISGDEGGTPKSAPPCLPVATIACVGLFAMTLFSIRPVATESTALAIAQSALQQGHQGAAERAIQKAVLADDWSIDAVLFESEWLKSKRISDPDSAQIKRDWQESLDQLISRAGESPSVYRQIANQRMHLYQVYGEKTDLQGAKEWYAQAFAWSPSNQWLAAQLAEIAREEGAIDESRQLANQAKRLSELGGNLERALWLQQIHVAKFIGRSAAGRAQLRSARELLFGSPP